MPRSQSDLECFDAIEIFEHECYEDARPLSLGEHWASMMMNVMYDEQLSSRDRAFMLAARRAASAR